MSARAIATGTVSFGLVSIPIKLYSATQPAAGVGFNLLHKKDSSRLKQHYRCTACNEEVPREEMVKGYEFAKDRYVTFTTEEIKELEEKATQTIDIAEFIPREKIDPIYFDKPYYLGPDKGGDKAYQLLARAMEETGRVALARYAARGKGYLVLLRPLEGKLVMQQLLYADEVRAFAEVPVGEAQVKDSEMKLARQLIEQIASDNFRPDAYQDEVRKRIMDVIQKKMEGQEVSLAAPETARAQIIDLMEALKASIAAKPVAPSLAVAGGGEEEERKPAKRTGKAAPAAKEAKKASR
jgi:DNA end-binding protein Ku